MKREIYMAMIVAMTMGLAAGSSVAHADDDNERVYGRELMSENERSEQRDKMRNMSEDERAGYRAEQHERMEERAREQGKDISEMGERGKGQGMGRGDGSGQGRGMGQGRGSGGGMGWR